MNSLVHLYPVLSMMNQLWLCEEGLSRPLSEGCHCSCFSCVGSEDETKKMRRKNNMKLKTLAKNPEAFYDEVFDDY